MALFLDLLFGLCLALLLTHELDAVRGKEWRVLPVLNALSDDAGRTVFIALHVPLFWLILDGCWSAEAATRETWRLALAGFGPLHYGLHWLFRDHPFYDFDGWLSQGLIIGYGALGALYVGLALTL